MAPSHNDQSIAKKKMVRATIVFVTSEDWKTKHPGRDEVLIQFDTGGKSRSWENADLGWHFYADDFKTYCSKWHYGPQMRKVKKFIEKNRNGFYWLYERTGLKYAKPIKETLFTAVEDFIKFRYEPQDFKELLQAALAPEPKNTTKGRVRRQVGSPAKKAKSKRS